MLRNICLMRTDRHGSEAVCFRFSTDFRAGVERLKKCRYFVDPEVEHVLVFRCGTKFFEHDIYLKRHMLLMDKVIRSLA